MCYTRITWYGVTDKFHFHAFFGKQIKWHKIKTDGWRMLLDLIVLSYCRSLNTKQERTTKQCKWFENAATWCRKERQISRETLEGEFQSTCVRRLMITRLRSLDLLKFLESNIFQNCRFSDSHEKRVSSRMKWDASREKWVASRMKRDASHEKRDEVVTYIWAVLHRFY